MSRKVDACLAIAAEALDESKKSDDAAMATAQALRAVGATLLAIASIAVDREKRRGGLWSRFTASGARP